VIIVNNKACYQQNNVVRTQSKSWEQSKESLSK